MKTYIKETYNSYTEDGVPHELALEYTISDVYQKLCSEGVMTEDLRKWFGKGKTGSSGGGGWDRYVGIVTGKHQKWYTPMLIHGVHHPQYMSCMFL